MVNNKKDFCFYIIGFIFIFGVLNTFHNTMVFDIDFFRHFSACFGRNVYTDINCPAYGDTIFFKPNYPAFGIVFTSGFFWLFSEFINNDNYVQVFRNYLGIFDFISYIIFFNILKVLDIKNYQIKSLTLIILPPILLSGSMFGQIDHVMLTFFLGFLYFIILDFKNKYKKLKFFNLSLILLGLLFLTKLQSIFLIPGILIALFINIYLTIKYNNKLVLLKIFFIFLFLILFICIDVIIFDVPNYLGINSTLLHSFIYGKSAASIISLHATNIWSVFDKLGFNIFNGVYEPIINIELQSNSFKNLTVQLIPLYIGLIFFLLYCSEFLINNTYKIFINLTNKNNENSFLKNLSLILLVSSSVYLFYCTLMPGMNIRYIYLFYPIFLLYILIIPKYRFELIIFLASSFFFSGIVSHSIGLKFISQLFPILPYEINKLSLDPLMNDMQTFGAITNLILIFYLFNNQIYRNNNYRFVNKNNFFILIILLFSLHKLYFFNPIKIVFDKEQSLKKFDIYFDYGHGFAEKDKENIDINKENSISVSKNLRSFRLDPEITQETFSIGKIEIENKKEKKSYRIETLKNISKKTDLYFIKDMEDPYIIFKIENFRSQINIDIKIIILIMILAFIFIRIYNQILIFNNEHKKFNK